jgi:hypothetical protein
MSEHDARWWGDPTSAADRERLRDFSATFIEMVAHSVRTRLSAQEHPIDAMVNGTMLLEAWEEAFVGPGPQPPFAYAREVEALLTRAHLRVGPARLWEWITRPNPALLRDASPLDALVAHQLGQVSALAELELTKEPTTMTQPEPQPEKSARARMRMSVEDYDRLVDAGILEGPIELLDGIVQVSGFPFVFGPEQTRRAADELGIGVFSCLDAVMSDPAMRAEAALRLAAQARPETRQGSADEPAS